jgi:hypothetical protein
MECFPCTTGGIREVRDRVAEAGPCLPARRLAACRAVDYARPTGSAGRVGPIGLTLRSVDKDRHDNEHAFAPSPKRLGSLRYWPIRICTMAQMTPALGNSRRRWSTPTVFDSYFYIHIVFRSDHSNEIDSRK